jgi:hypothetical protein
MAKIIKNHNTGLRSPGSQNVLAKKILEYVLAHIVEFKKLNQEPRMGGGFMADDDVDYE